jgi:aspartyl-tRNA(Asn)/glutamyl-tRNA(Gln) amidotransferase subunit A
MHHKTIAELSRELSAKKISSVELTRHYLDRIKSLDEKLNSFITITEEQAIKAAEAADAALAKGNHSPLTGIPIAQKDIFCTDGVKTSCGSKMLDNFIAPYDATVVSRLVLSCLVKPTWMNSPWVPPTRPVIMAR